MMHGEGSSYGLVKKGGSQREGILLASSSSSFPHELGGSPSHPRKKGRKQEKVPLMPLLLSRPFGDCMEEDPKSRT